jgi:hypothetical protein
LDALPGDKSIKKIIWAFRERKSLEKNKMEAFSPDKGLKKKFGHFFARQWGHTGKRVCCRAAMN